MLKRALELGKNDFEDLLFPGCASIISFDMNKAAPRMRSTLRGWRYNAYFIFDIPADPSARELIGRSTHCIARMFADGTAIAFRSHIIDMTDEPHPVFRVAWPTQTETLPLRKTERVPFRSACSIDVNGEPGQGELLDISLGGCGVVSARPLDPGMVITVGFTLPDGRLLQNVSAIVRSSAHEDGPGWLLGCSFQELSSEQVEALHYIVSLRLDQAEDGDHHVRRVLLMGQSGEYITELRGLFESQGYQVLLTGSVLESLFRLRLQQPSAFILAAQTPEISGIDVCGMIRRAHGFDRMAIFLYGEIEPGKNEALRNAGVDGVFRSLGTTDQVFKQVIQAIYGRQNKS